MELAGLSRVVCHRAPGRLKARRRTLEAGRPVSRYASIWTTSTTGLDHRTRIPRKRHRAFADEVIHLFEQPHAETLRQMQRVSSEVRPHLAAEHEAVWPASIRTEG
jgi:hypothetical protein